MPAEAIGFLGYRAKGRRVYLVHVPGAVQTQILAGCHAITRKHADWAKIGLANSLYGGAFNSRLVMNIREDKGYTYSPRSAVHALRQYGYFSVSAAVRNDVVAASLTEVFYELDKLRSLPVPEAELADARNYLSGVFSMSLATQDGLLSQLATVADTRAWQQQIRDSELLVLPGNSYHVAATHAADSFNSGRGVAYPSRTPHLGGGGRGRA